MESMLEKWASPQPVDEVLHKLTTDAVQSQERLLHGLKVRQRADTESGTSSQVSDQMVRDCFETRDKLCSIRSEIEGTALQFDKIEVNAAAAQSLKQLLLMHTKSTLTDETRDRLLQLVLATFRDQWKRLLFVAMVSCPWYSSASQDERGIRAKHNQILIVYVSHDKQFFAPVNSHLKENGSEVFDHEDWLYATEVYHFAHHLLKGKVRFVESLFLPQSSMLFVDECFVELINLATQCRITGLSAFIEQCRGQAVSGVGHKRKKGRFVMKDVVTLHQFCESFRMMQHATSVISDSNINMDSPLCDGDDLQMTPAAEALRKLTAAYDNQTCDSEERSKDGESVVDKASLFALVMKWKDYLDEKLTGFKFTSPDNIQKLIGHWLGGVRMQDPYRDFHLSDISSVDRTRLHELLEKIGGPVAVMPPEQIVLVAQAGSYLYGVSTPESDADFVVIYARPTMDIVRSTSRPTEGTENRGPTKTIEYGAYEVRLFAEMLWKASVVILELVFADDLEYCHPAWKALVRHRQLFVTENAIRQYSGLVKHNLSLIASRKHEGTSRECKIIYQIFHKLHALEFFLRGECPQIKIQGEMREFILNIRKGYGEGPMSRDALYSEAKKQFCRIQESLNARTERLPENVPYKFLLEWIMSIRGL